MGTETHSTTLQNVSQNMPPRVLPVLRSQRSSSGRQTSRQCTLVYDCLLWHFSCLSFISTQSWRGGRSEVCRVEDGREWVTKCSLPLISQEMLVGAGTEHSLHINVRLFTRGIKFNIGRRELFCCKISPDNTVCSDINQQTTRSLGLLILTECESVFKLWLAPLP